MRITLPVFQKLSFLVALTLSSSLIVAGSAQGQTTVSIQAGTSLSTETVDGETLFDVGYGTGLAVRAWVYLPLPGILGLQIGATFVQKRVPAQGMAFDGFSGAEFDIASMSDTRYLQLPVLLRITPRLEGPVSPRFMAGPVISFALNCSYSSTIRTPSINPNVVGYVTLDKLASEGCDENHHRILELGIAAGVGINMAVSQSLSLTLDFLYDYGLSSISKTKYLDIRNRAFAIMAGVAFPIR